MNTGGYIFWTCVLIPFMAMLAVWAYAALALAWKLTVWFDKKIDKL